MFDPEDGSTAATIRNVGSYLPIDTAGRPQNFNLQQRRCEKFKYRPPSHLFCAKLA
jgi:hypothetical protein